MRRIGDILADLGYGEDRAIRSPEAKRKFAQYLRENQTPSERLMARVLFHLGIDAEPQVPILGWIADFYDASTKTVIEVDGSIHAYQREADAFRDKKMREAGYRVYRFRNDEIRHFMANIAADRSAA